MAFFQVGTPFLFSLSLSNQLKFLTGLSVQNSYYGTTSAALVLRVWFSTVSKLQATYFILTCGGWITDPPWWFASSMVLLESLCLSQVLLVICLTSGQLVYNLDSFFPLLMRTGWAWPVPFPMLRKLTLGLNVDLPPNLNTEVRLNHNNRLYVYTCFEP